jgi:diphthamide synthase subunit DPH2
MNNEETNIKLVTVAVANQPHEASMLKAILEEAGITVFLQNEMLAQLYANVVGGITIQVPDTDAEKARNLLIEGGYNL